MKSSRRRPVGGILALTARQAREKPVVKHAGKTIEHMDLKLEYEILSIDTGFGVPMHFETGSRIVRITYRYRLKQRAGNR